KGQGPAPTTVSVAAANGPFATAQTSVPSGNGFNECVPHGCARHRPLPFQGIGACHTGITNPTRSMNFN
ncbi:MAG: hypothetical protein JXA67_05580, partial [Micromonosporaceae bacterium]|nr:hypothetical protein [Micromonosporaceae bacterium]